MLYPSSHNQSEGCNGPHSYSLQPKKHYLILHHIIKVMAVMAPIHIHSLQPKQHYLILHHIMNARNEIMVPHIISLHNLAHLLLFFSNKNNFHHPLPEGARPHPVQCLS